METGEDLVASVLRDLDSSPLSQKDKAMLRFVNKVNVDSPAITAVDMEPLYAEGWEDDAIYYAITVCSLFNFYNRWIDCKWCARAIRRSAPAGSEAFGRGRVCTEITADPLADETRSGYQGWRVAFAASVGVFVSFASVLVYTFGIF